MSTQFALLKTKRFFPLFVTQFFGAFNDNVFKNALIILITYRLGATLEINPQILVTLAAGIFILPFFLFSATAGQLADKVEKSRLITYVKLAEIVLMVIASIAFYLQSVPLLMAVLFLLGVQATFFGPLKYAILPNLLKVNELIAGNGLIEAGTFVSILMGTILGGLLVLLPYGEYIISIIICLLAFIGFISSLFIPDTHVNNPNIRLSVNFIAETYRIIRYSKQHGGIFISILAISWFWLFGAVFLSEMPVFAKDTLHANEHVVTLFLALFSIGIAVGSLLCNRLLRGRVNATFVPLGALGMTIFAIDLYFATQRIMISHTTELVTVTQFLTYFHGWRICVDLFLIALCGGIYTVPLYAIVQHRSDEQHRARVIASNNIINSMFMVLAAIATMLMLKLNFSVVDVFLTLAIINGFVALYICKLLPDLIIKEVLRWILSAIYRVKVVGLDNYFTAGQRVVIIANHTSFLDAALLAAFLPDKLTYAVDTATAEKPWIKLFLKIVDTFKIHPTDPMAIKSLIDYVKHDKRCVIFPEGRLTMTGALMKIYEGPGLVADKANAKLLPIHIQGAQYTPFSRLKGKVPIQLAPKITLTIFPAQPLNISDVIKGRERRRQIGLKLYDIMTTLMFRSSDYQKTIFNALIDAKNCHGRYRTIAQDITRQSISYGQLIQRAFILGKFIAKQSKSGESVGILLPTMNSAVITFFSILANGRVPAMLNYTAGVKNILIACQTAKIRSVYTSRQFVEAAKLESIVNALKQENIHVTFLENLKNHFSLKDKLNGFLFGCFPRIAYRYINRGTAALDPESTAVILFTSGSEGTPKGVVLSHQNIQANRFQLSACIDFNSNDKVLNMLPIFHSFGLTAGMILPLLSGVNVFFYPSPLHYRIVPQLAYDINCTILFSTDTFLTGYAKYANPYDFYSVRYVFAGAEKLRDETIITWQQRFGVRIFDGYGATETSPVLATNTPMKNKMRTVGRLLPDIEYQLNSVPGISDGGVLIVKGPNVMKGYLLADKPGVLQPPSDGWYNTGDVVSIDDEGFITIKGRVKRFAKIGGEMVSLTMVEQQINLLWPMYQNAILSLPDAKKGEQLILVTTNPDATREHIVSFAKTIQMGEIAIPKKIIIYKQLPLLGSGKIDYTALKEMINS